MNVDPDRRGEDLGASKAGLPSGVAAALKQLKRAMADVHAALQDRPCDAAKKPVTPQQVRALIDARQRRSAVFSPHLFFEPAWDILLELYACGLEYRMPSIAELTLAVALPGTTVLRWLDTLTGEGLLTREDDPRDVRKVRISLSQDGMTKMGNYFDEYRS